MMKMKALNIPDDEDESPRGNEHVGRLFNHTRLRELLENE